MYLPSKTRQYAAVGTLLPAKMGKPPDTKGTTAEVIGKVLPIVIGAVLLSYAYKSLVGNDEKIEDPGLPEPAPVDGPNPIDTPPVDTPPEISKPAIPELPPMPPVKEVPLPKPTPLLTDWLQKLKNLFSWTPRKTETAAPVDEPSKKPSTANMRTRLSNTLPDGYRTEFIFPEFPGSSAVSKYGIFTKEEASTLTRLKLSKANTSASGGMSPEIRNLIIGKARAYGLDPEMMLKVAAIESGGNPNAVSSTGAIGIFQFTGDTANRVGLVDRFDPEANIECGMILAVKNTGTLANMGVAVDSTSLYLAHQLGPAAAKEVLLAAPKGDKAPISSLSARTQSAVRKNLGGNTARTAKEYVEATNYYLESKYAALKPRANSLVASKEEAPPVAISTDKGVAVAVPTSASPTRTSSVKRHHRSHRVAEDDTTKKEDSFQHTRSLAEGRKGSTKSLEHSLVNVPEEPDPSEPAKKFAQHYMQPNADSSLDVPPGAEQHPAQGRLAYGSPIDLLRGPSGLIISTS